jgi:hypothetical protein
MACKENHLTDWKITKRIPINKDNSKKISDSFSSDNYRFLDWKLTGLGKLCSL